MDKESMKTDLEMQKIEKIRVEEKSKYLE